MKFLEERYQGDKIFGSAKVYFSSLIKHKKDAGKRKTLVFNNDEEEDGKIDIEYT